MAKMILSAFADEYSDNFESQLEFLNSANIGYLEIRGVDGKSVAELSLDEVKKCKKQLVSHRIKISSVGSPLGKISLSDNMNEHLETAKRIFETAGFLETKYCRIFSFYIPKNKPCEEFKAEVFERMEKLLELAKIYGVILCHENEDGIYGETPKRCAELIKHFGGRIKCVFDMGNFVLNGCNPYPDGYNILSDSIEYFHIKDSLAAGAIVPPGLGEAKIKEVITDHLGKAQKDFFVTIEPHLQTFGGFNALTDRTFDNPYKFETREIAFEEAVKRFRELFNKEVIK